jgi:glycosyltransferase involved in cell wall biosynthesis
MLRWKRVDTLIKAVGCLLKEGRNIQLTLVGHGPEEARLRKLSDQILKSLSAAGAASDIRSSASGLSSQEEPLITFHPPVPIAQVRDFMRQADVYVLPSDGGEGWGAVVNEAMEEGCSVIATHECGAGATMIKDGQNGLLFRAGDVSALANRLRRMQDEPELRQELANNGRATVGQIWGPDVAAERLVAFCQAVLDGQPCPRYSDGPLSEALG